VKKEKSQKIFHGQVEEYQQENPGTADGKRQMVLGQRVFGKRAEFAFGEAFRLDVVDAVETSARVFPGNDSGEFNKLAFREVGAQGGVEFVGDVGGRAGELCGEAKDDFFDVVEVGAGLESPEVLKLLLGDALFSAHGRVDVDSKRTTDHQGDFELGEFFEMKRDHAFACGVHVEPDGVAQVFAVEGANARSERNAA
jgi:hypothetical protein